MTDIPAGAVSDGVEQTPSLITPKNMRIIIGACLAIGGNLLISIAMNIQKYSLSRLASQQAQETTTSATTVEVGASKSDEKKLLVVTEVSSVPADTYLKSKLWWLGITLMLIGEVGNFMAYGFGPASVVAPLGTTTVVANAYIAIIFLGEKLRWQDVIGTYIIIVGAFLIITFSTQQDTQLTAEQIRDHLLAWPFIVYFITECVLFCGAIHMQTHRVFIREDHVILHILPAALISSLTIISAKAVAGMIALSMDGNSQLQYPMFYFMLLILVFTGVIQIKFVTSAMKDFDSTVVVPTYFVFFTLSAILAGVFFYAEFYGLSFVQLIMFCFGCFCSFLGVYLITQGRNKTDEKEEEFNLPSQINSELSALCPFPYTVQMVQPAGEAERKDGVEDGAAGTEQGGAEAVQPEKMDAVDSEVKQSPDNPESWLFSSDTNQLDSQKLVSDKTNTQESTRGQETTGNN
ncbi:NIPA-like protein 2 isoform X2 [Apostichopus japonicus]|uniref:NIPA-like protein 2 isoform X2 n=1 Tax=Stichopus japonicus TaxID=307972 RepID=UPI003AB27D46